MKIFYLAGAILLSVSLVAAQEDSIKNFLRVNKEFCTGGQPSLQHLEKLKADGSFIADPRRASLLFG